MAPGTVVLGKRKRKVQTGKAAAGGAEADKAAALEEAQAIFRKHFESQFAPLEGSDVEATRPAAQGRRKAAKGMEIDDDDDEADGVEDMRSEDSESDSDSDSEEAEDEQDDWNGLSGDEDDDDDDDDTGHYEEETNNQVEIVDYSKPTPSFSTSTPQTALMTKREMRAYLSSRPPEDAVSSAESKAQAKQRRAGAGADDDDAQNEDSRSLLANDLELQRLISESHILSATNPFNAAVPGAANNAAGKAFSEGRTRALTTDLRLQKLGSRESIFKQHKMPMGMRKGISSARAAREEKRRREAKENGIILERPAGDGSGKQRRRKRPGLAVDMPGMGRMKGGELRLSKRDVRAVEMEGKRAGGSGRKSKHRKRR